MGLGIIKKGIPQQVYQDSVSDIFFLKNNLLLFLFVFVSVLFIVGFRFSVSFVILFSVFLHRVSLGSCFQQSNVASVMDNQRR